jgi:hypothetical protein
MLYWPYYTESLCNIGTIDAQDPVLDSYDSTEKIMCVHTVHADVFFLHKPAHRVAFDLPK